MTLVSGPSTSEPPQPEHRTSGVHGPGSSSATVGDLATGASHAGPGLPAAGRDAAVDAAPVTLGGSATARRSPGVVGMLAGLQAAFTGLLACVLVGLATWIASPAISVPWQGAAAVAANVWLVGHGAPLALAAGAVGIVPLGLTAALLGLCWLAGNRVDHAVRPGPAARRHALVAIASGTAVYVVIAAVMALVSASDDARAPLGSALLATAAVSAAGMAGACRRHWLPTALPERLVLAAAAIRTSLIGWAAVALVTLLLGVAFGWGRIVEVQQALHPGWSGHVVLVLIQALALPTALVWAGAYASGAGFAVGTGTWVSPGSVELGPLPAFPLLGALPTAGEHPLMRIVLPAALVLVAAVAGYRWRVARGVVRPVVVVAETLGWTAVAAAVLALLAALSSGAVGPGRMAELGPHWLGVVGHGWLELLVGALLGALLAAAPAGSRRSQAARAAGDVRRAARRAGSDVRRVARSRRPRR